MYKITNKQIKIFSKNINSDENFLIKKNAISNNSLKDIVKDTDELQKINKVFSKEIDIKVKNTNQRNSGRCWIFAFLNLLRLDMIKKYDLEDNFEFSQNYLFFWDKLEKSNFFLNNILKTKNHKLDSRLVQYLLSEPVSDGGQWNMIVNLVNKYGIIPKKNMNETFSSSNTEDINYILNNKLRNFAYEIRTKKITHKHIETYLQEVYELLVMFLGEPPKKFSWEYYSIKKEKKKYNILKDITPIIYYKKYIPFEVNDMVCLVNAPCKSKPFYNIFDLKYFGNVLGGKKSNFINIPIDEMINIAKKSLDNNQAIWFGSDVNEYLDEKKGLLNNKYLKYDHIFPNMDKLNKGERLEYCVSRITHAMLIKGYNKNNVNKKDKINQWLVENSWGDENEIEGDLIMSNDWFKEYVLEIVVHKKNISKKILENMNKKPILLEPWDPLGLLLIKNIKSTHKKIGKKINKTKKNNRF
jgi:bleomycin hydrolase